MKRLFTILALAASLALLVQAAPSSKTPTPSEALAAAAEATINWLTMEEALAAQKMNPKKIMIDVYTQWCGPCKMLDKNTFHHTEVVKYVNANYYAVKFDAESPDPVTYKDKTYTNPDYDPARKGRNGVHQLTRAFGVSAYPTIVFLDETQNIIAPIRGYQGPPQIELYLKFFNEDKHKTINTQPAWEQYRDSFVPSWS